MVLENNGIQIELTSAVDISTHLRLGWKEVEGSSPAPEIPEVLEGLSETELQDIAAANKVPTNKNMTEAEVLELLEDEAKGQEATS